MNCVGAAVFVAIVHSCDGVNGGKDSDGKGGVFEGCYSDAGDCEGNGRVLVVDDGDVAIMVVGLIGVLVVAVLLVRSMVVIMVDGEASWCWRRWWCW